MDQIAIGARIKAARERVHLTQEQLAEIIDISPTHMSVIERGVKTKIFIPIEMTDFSFRIKRLSGS